MKDFPFSVYDSFGYLACGILFGFGLVYIIGRESIEFMTVSVTSGIVYIIIAYIVGQILAWPAKGILEDIVVKKWLGPPWEKLFDKPNKWHTLLFLEYFEVLPDAISNRIQNNATSEELDVSDKRALHFYILGKSTTNDTLKSHLNTFLILYGFCRNMSFTFLALTIIAFTHILIKGAWYNLPLPIIAFIVSVGLFYRYLKFFRQYTFELFITYAAQPKEIE